ncbi:TonB-dependent receptor plug domain-containing protein [Pseudoduganella namucuonensis]|nr:TonB-dependent receptor [Pseudoduganella namucuonensis]
MSFEELGSIDVSASSLLPTTLLSAGSSITSVGPQEWERGGARRTLEALDGTPGVFVMPHTNGNQVLAIRGYARLTSFTGVAVTLDGVPLTDLYRSSPQYNFPGLNLGVMSQMQLIQGPGSALYGSDAFHGLLALRTHDDEEAGQQGAVAAGGKGYQEAAARFARTLGGGGRWSMAFAENGQGDQERTATRPNPAGGTPIAVARENRFLSRTAVLKASSGAGDGWKFNAGLYLHRYGADNFQGLGSRLAGAGDLGGLDTRFAMLQAGAGRRVGDTGSLELKAYGWWVDNDLAGRLQLPSGAVQRDLYSRQDRVGLQAIYRDSSPSWRTDWALALASEQLNVRDVHVVLHTPAGAFLSDTRNAASDARRRVRSATLELNSRLGRDWRAVYGGRVDDYSDFGRQASPRLGLIYQPNDSGALKLLYGQAFRAPSAAERNGTVNTVLGNAGLKPEVIDSLELVAIRQRDNLLWQASVFKTAWRDGIAIVFRPDIRINQFQNVERNRAHGVTASVTWRAEGWQFEAGGAWVASRNASTGAPYNIQPRRSANASLARGLFDGAGRAGVALRWMDGFDDIPRGDVFAPGRLPSYARADLSYSHTVSKSLTLTAVVRNLFDRDSRLPSPLGSVGGIPDDRVNAILRANLKF